MLSPAGVFSGTSGKQKTTQEWISAKLNCPTRLSLFMGLKSGEEGSDRKKRYDKKGENMINEKCDNIYTLLQLTVI